MTSRSSMQSEPAVAVGSSQRTWVAELMSYAQDHAGVRVVGTVLSAREALEAEYDVLLIDDTTSYLTKRLIDRVQLKRRVVIGVYESTRGDVGRVKLLDMGADAVIDADASAKEFLARIKYVTEQRLVDRDFAEMVADEVSVDEKPPEVSTSSGADRSTSTTVVSGSNGVTEVATALAATLAMRGEPVVLADLDTLEPSIAQRLGLELNPNLLTMVEGLRHSGEVARVPTVGTGDLSVLAGLPSPREWEACTPDDAADLVQELAADHTNAIVKVSRHLEDLSPFGARSGRFEVGRRVVAQADHLVVVGDPSPTGVTAILSWIGDARTLSSAPVHIVFNHCGRSLYQQGEIAQEVGRTFASTSVIFAPEDLRVRKAAWQGEIPPPGRFMKALTSLAMSVAAPSVGSTRSGVDS